MDETNRAQPGEPPVENSRPSETPAFGAEETPSPPETSREARNMAMLCHLLGVAGFFAPLMIWLIEREKHRFVDEHGRDAMNYQASLLLYYAVSGLLAPLLIGLVMLSVLTVMHVVLVIIGALKASRGEPWHYPIAIPFLK
jgi:uncharacterized Tic20 family protein